MAFMLLIATIKRRIFVWGKTSKKDIIIEASQNSYSLSVPNIKLV